MIDARTLRPGDICTFRTAPINPAVGSGTGRHAALKVLIVGESVLYAVLGGVFDAKPSFEEAMNLPVLRRHRFAFAGQPAVLGTPRAWSIDLLGFAVLGNACVTPEELAFVPRYPLCGTWSGASVDAEGEWRWRHDREALKRDVELAAAARETRNRVERERRASRLKQLTWEALLVEPLFARWSPSPPFPDPGFVDALRTIFREAVIDLSAMGPRPSKPAVRRVLRALVERINVLDEAHGKIIETEEREDLLSVLGELTFLARQRDLDQEIDGWRTW